MAMPATFWRDEQKLDIFKTKPCQRLCDDGVCKWRSRCQYSHCLDAPRRQLRKYQYSPQICPKMQLYRDEAGTVQVKNMCGDGLKCQKAHSKEEVFYHPLIFKTQLCEEYSSNSGNAGMKTPSAKHKRCHRFYCPFAHGNNELRTSTIPEELRDGCLRMAALLPSDSCCKVCTPYSFPRAFRPDPEDIAQPHRPASTSKATQTSTFVISPPPFPCPPIPPSVPPYRFAEPLGPGLCPRASPSPGETAEALSSPREEVEEESSRRLPTYKLWSDGPAFVSLVGDSIVGVGPKELVRGAPAELREPLVVNPRSSLRGPP